MKIVPMNPSHTQKLAQLEKLCFSDPWSVNAFNYELTNPLSVWLVAEEDEEVIGYVGAQAVLDEADMMNIAVSPEYRKKGVAQSLIAQLICRLDAENVRCLTLEVRSSNHPAIFLYQKLGFFQVGVRPNYYRHPKEDALILRKEWRSCEY